MTPRQSLDIATAALRWQTARERRLAVGAEKRRADAVYKAPWTGIADVTLNVGQRLLHANTALAEIQRQERAATRALTKACIQARADMQVVDVSTTVLEIA